MTPVALRALFLAAASLDPSGPPDTRTVVAGERYAAGPVTRVVLGAHYRDVWTVPVVVPVLDVGSFGGGLTPVKRGGGFQTKSLRLKGADGRTYVFRSVDKDPSAVLPKELVGTIAARLVQDQISSAHPGAPLVVAPLASAAGVLAASPRLFVMPDDARLGEFREAFANVLGLLEERADEGEGDDAAFAGARKVVGTPRLFERLREDADERVDARAFLRARLLDVFLGDWDRHADQWRWARIGEEKDAAWLPVPRDRDQAFARFDGLVPTFARFVAPQLVGFDSSYPPLFAVTWNGRDLDRRFLNAMTREDFGREAASLVAALRDDVLAGAVAALPPEWREKSGVDLERRLRARRDLLPAAAESFYRLLAREVEIRGTDEAEEFRVARTPAGGVVVTVLDRRKHGGRKETYRRSFDPRDTREIRLVTGGGDDDVVVSGDAGALLTLRVVTGAGRDRVDAVSGGGIRVYTADGDAAVTPGRGTDVDPRPYAPPTRVNGRGLAPAPRDWGGAWFPRLALGAGRETGFVLGVGALYRGYGFRRNPHAWELGLVASAATNGGYRLVLDGDRTAENSRRRGSFLFRASNLEVVRFFGFGNETPAPESERFYEVRQRQVRLQATLDLPLGPDGTLSVGPFAEDARLDEDRRETFLGSTRPYGAGRFARAGAVAAWRLDTRDVPANPRHGVAFEVGGGLTPAWLDVEEAFGEAHVRGSAYVPLGGGRLEPTLAVRASARKVWGPYPFHEAAFVGGADTVRGLPEQRFAGDASVAAGAELRLALGRFFVVLPGDYGVFALADAGRVFLSGESSTRVHASAGAGLWFAFLGRANTISLAVARSEGRTGLYLRTGMAF